MGSITRQSRGFTLIELLLVLVVITVMLSLAAAALPDRNRERLGNEANRLLKVLETLQMEAMLNRTPTGLVLGEDGYQSLILNLYTLEWEASALKILAPRALQGHGLALELLEAEGVTGTSIQGPDGERLPAIIFDASGSTQPYQLQLASITVDGLGAILASDGHEAARLQ